MHKAVVAISLFCIALSAYGNDFFEGAQRGYWEGKIGDKTVNVCLDDNFGSTYYYVGHIVVQGIDIYKTEKNQYIESFNQTNTGTWENISSKKDMITGTWASINGEKKLPIKLKFKIPLKNSRDCPDEFFSAIQKTLATSEKKGTFRDIETTEILITKVADYNLSNKSSSYKFHTYKIKATTNEMEKFNDIQEDWIKSKAGFMYECNGNDSPAGAEESIEPFAKAGPILVSLEKSDIYCGGTHPNFYRSYINFDLEHGKIIEPWDLIKAKRIVKVCIDNNENQCHRLVYPSSELMREIHLYQKRKMKNGDKECLDVLQEQDTSYDIGIVKNGLIFSSKLSHAVQACDMEIHLPYTIVKKYLNQDGIKIMNRVIHHQGSL